MDDYENRISRLLEQLDQLNRKQESFIKEIHDLRTELIQLKESSKTNIPTEHKLTAGEIIRENIIEKKEQKEEIRKQVIPPVTVLKESELHKSTFNKLFGGKSDFEKFIGENLINKIGIVIIVIGVGIGTKYAINHQLISPLFRIIMGYILGAALLGFAIRLKKQYENFSAVLLSGSMAIFYFITYSAYSFYSLIPQVPAFLLMVFFTVFTVLAAINYNRQVIAHIGLVGAYAVPMLLSENTGKIAVLFTYMSIINTGILIIALKKYWISLYYSAFFITWLIFFQWYLFQYSIESHFSISLIFLPVFFIIFYLTFLAYKLALAEKFFVDDILLLLANSFVFFGLGYVILKDHPTGTHFLGLFTLVNAIIHALISVFLYYKKYTDKNLYYFAAGLVIVFITIAVPVQLDGRWVTMLWAGESCLVFWIGRTRKIKWYEFLSYPLMIITFFSIIHDWFTLYGNYTSEDPVSKINFLFNVNFLSSLIVIAFFSFINLVNYNRKYVSPLDPTKDWPRIISMIVPAVLIIIVYFSIGIEISTYWDQLYSGSAVKINNTDADGSVFYKQNMDLPGLKTIWLINYSMVFLSILSLLNIFRFKNKILGLANLILNTWLILVFLTMGLFELSALRESFLTQSFAEYFNHGIFNIIIRYISFLFAGSLIGITWYYTRQNFLEARLSIQSDLLIIVSLLWIFSSELINWMDLSGVTQSYKLGLSILWGIYSLILVVIGIWKRKVHIRIAAIVLFGITLLKLFFYDIAYLEMIAKAIIFISLGILLLIISFLYIRFKDHIFNDGKN